MSSSHCTLQWSSDMSGCVYNNRRAEIYLKPHIPIVVHSTHQFTSIQLLGHVWLFATAWTAASQASLSITNSRSLHKLMSIESAMPSNYLILCRPLLLLLSIFPRNKVFSNESVFASGGQSIGSFSFNISRSNEYSGLISFRIDWLDLLTVQGTLKSLLQHHSLKTSILLCSAFFIVQLSHPYVTIGKNKDLTRWTFVGQVMSLVFNMLSRFVIDFLPRSICSDFEAPQHEVSHCFHCFPIYLPWWEIGIDICILLIQNR